MLCIHEDLSSKPIDRVRLDVLAQVYNSLRWEVETGESLDAHGPVCPGYTMADNKETVSSKLGGRDGYL